MHHDGATPSEDWEGVFEGLSAERLREFLTLEMRGNAGLRRRFLSRFGRRGTTSRTKFRAEIEAAYERMGDAGHYGEELYFDDFFGAAKASANRGDYDEALWMYQEISEAIADHMEDVDDSYAHYGTHHDVALDGMVDCMGGLALGCEQKRPHIAYLHDRIAKDNYGLGVQYADALTKICTDGPDRQYLRELRRQRDSAYPIVKTILDRICKSKRRTA